MFDVGGKRRENAIKLKEPLSSGRRLIKTMQTEEKGTQPCIAFVWLQAFCTRVLPVEYKRVGNCWHKLVGEIISEEKGKNRKKERKKTTRKGCLGRRKKCSCLSGEMVWEIKNAHIQPLRFGELFLFSPIEQFEHQGRKTTKPVNICHSLSATLQWWLAHGGESVLLSRRLSPAASLCQRACMDL